jgi:energy-coupling factor transport system ATP-binding protein
MVFQYPEYQLFDATVEADVGFGPKNLGLSKDETAARVREAIELVGLDYGEVKERSPFELSGGQKRRAALAGILAMRPNTLILDEPTAGLDPSGKAEILALVHRIKAKTTPTVIFVSHNMDEVADNCNRVAWLSRGTARVFGTRELFCDHAAELVQEGLDLPSWGRIAAALREKGMEIPPVYRREQLLSALFERLPKGARP